MSTTEEVRISAGSAVKSLGGGRYGGFGVPFGGAPDCDLDVFDPGMTLEDLGLDDGRKTIPMLFSHGQDKTVGKRRIAKGVFELRPGEGLWVEWKFDRVSDSTISNIRDLADEGLMALSSAAAPHMVIREPKESYRLIKHWPVVEVSLTGSACCLSGRTKVGSLKGFEGFTLDEMIRRRGMSEGDLLREESEEIRYRAHRALGTKCDDEWMAQQRNKRVQVDDERRERLARNITAETAKERLDRAIDLLAKTEKYAAEVEAERARLHLGPGIPYRHLEDWILAGQKSGFINSGMRW